MSLYHCSIKVLGKSGGRSAVQFSAYMSGEKMYNERTGETYDHTTKEEIIFNTFFFTEDVPEDLRQADKFWNALEKNESADNARFARTWELALPRERPDKWEDMVREFVQSLIKDGYCAVQVAIHDKGDGNPHAHIMAPCRQMKKGEWVKAKEVKGYLCENVLGEQVAFASVKDIPSGYERIPLLDDEGNQKTDSRGRLQWKRATLAADHLNSKELLCDQRARWADIQNQYLLEKDQVSHLSYQAQGIEKEPTMHLGYKASQLEKQGVFTEKGNYNREVRYRNNEIENAHKEIENLGRERPTLYRIFTDPAYRDLSFFEKILVWIDKEDFILTRDYYQDAKNLNQASKPSWLDKKAQAPEGYEPIVSDSSWIDDKLNAIKADKPITTPKKKKNISHDDLDR